MDNPGEILRLCRLCLVKDQVNIPIFEEQGDIRQIFLKISSCLPVKVSRDDKLPKKICDGCSNKLDLLYEFWNTSANAEKTLLSWLGQAGVKDVDETISAVAQQIAKPAETQVKQETLEDGHATNQANDSFRVQSLEEEAKDESEAPPPKRARRTAAVKAQISITPESDDDDDMDSAEAMTKVEDESDESDGEDKDPSYGEVPGTSADDQAGPSGLGKDGVEAPKQEIDAMDLTFRCCAFVFDPQQSLTYHQDTCPVKQENAADQVLFCSQCSRFFTERTQFARHMRYHRDKLRRMNSDVVQTFPCPQCGKTCDTRANLTKHIKRVHEQVNAVKVTCLECNKVLKKSTIGHHMDRMHRGKVKVQQCDVCGVNYKGNLEVHMKLVHVKKYSVFCERCGKGFNFPGLLKIHMSRVHGEGDLISFSCTEEGCPKMFKSNASLIYHLGAAHPKEKYEKNCEQCKKTFTHPFLYRRHQRVHQKGPKRYSCDVCQKVLSAKWSLTDHMRSHSGERPFVCEHCGQGFISKKNLKSHYVVHTKERPFACKHCDTKYSQQGPLTRHVRLCHPELVREVGLQKGNSCNEKIIDDEN